MADLNEPKKEPERIGLPPVGAKPPTSSLRPPAPPSVAPRPVPPKEEVAAGPRPPARPTARPAPPATSGAARPPTGPPPPTPALFSRMSIGCPASSTSVGSDTAVAVARSAITRRAWTVETGLIAVGADHPRRVAGSCELVGQRLRCISSGSPVLGLARYFRADLAPATLELFLLIKLWKILWRSQSTIQILTAK